MSEVPSVDARKAVCRQYGLNPDLISSSDRRMVGERLQVVNVSSTDPKLTALHIPFWGRFGNSIFQIMNAVAFCEKHGLRKVYFEQPHPFAEPREIESITFALRRLDEIESTEGVLSLVCFHTHVLGFRQAQATAIGRRYVRALLSSTLEVRPAPADSLTISMRSGDVFSRSPHPGYGQPPLAFYLKVIEHAKPRQVTLVFEDDRNPVIGALHSHLDRVGLKVTVQNESLARDLECLLGAKQLVVANGTFGRVIAILASDLRRVYHFGQTCFEEYGLDARVIGVRDRAGSYTAAILSGNWHNTREQRRMMRKYPQSALEIVG